MRVRNYLLIACELLPVALLAPWPLPLVALVAPWPLPLVALVAGEPKKSRLLSQPAIVIIILV